MAKRPKKGPPRPSLPNPRREAFVREYLVDMNGTQAVLRAGYSSNGASVTAVRLLADPRIQEAIAAGKARLADNAEAKAEELLRECLRIAYLDPADLLDDDGNILPIKKMPVRVRRAISSVEFIMKNAAAGDGVIDRVMKIRFWDKGKGLELAGRYSGHLVDRKETGKPGEFARLSVDEKRAKARELAERILAKDQA